MRTHFGAGVAVVALLLSVLAGVGHAGTSGKQSFEARNVALKAGEWLAIALHPNEVPIEVDSSERDLEVCPASFDGQRPEDGNGSSWPSFADFDGCIALDSDGHVNLPSTVVDTFHLAFLVRGADGGRARIGWLTVSYEPEDPYFVVFPPPISAKERSSAFAVTPDVSTTVHVGAASIDYRPIRGVGVRVTQAGRRVRTDGAGELTRSGPGYGPVTLDRRVVVRVRNVTAEAQRVSLSMDWD